jgi:DNA uptake protein ComE-like DNA-binding protein
VLFLAQVWAHNGGMLRRFSRMAGVAAAALVLGCAAGSARPVELVDVNQATVAELMQVPGMTPVWAARIVRFRPYRSKLDLLDQGVVSPEVYQRIRDGVVAHRAAAATASQTTSK